MVKNMQYVSGLHALNISCQLATCGDWHSCSVNWNKLWLLDSTKIPFAEYGIETNRLIFDLEQQYNIANHIRACLDLIFFERYSIAQGMRNDFICNDEYDHLIFEKIILLNIYPHWNKINHFMVKEYSVKWIDYRNKYEKTL